MILHSSLSAHILTIGYKVIVRRVIPLNFCYIFLLHVTYTYNKWLKPANEGGIPRLRAVVVRLETAISPSDELEELEGRGRKRNELILNTDQQQTRCINTSYIVCMCVGVVCMCVMCMWVCMCVGGVFMCVCGFVCMWEGFVCVSMGLL